MRDSETGALDFFGNSSQFLGLQVYLADYVEEVLCVSC